MTGVWPGAPAPLGACWDGEGTNFAVFSQHATAVELCLFADPHAARETARVPLERSEHVWHAYLPDARPGQCYALRAHGPYAPGDGHRFNPAKLLLDPYARAISGTPPWSDALLGFAPDGDQDARDPQDSAGAMPKAIVVDNAFSWGDDRPPRIPWSRTVIYECHVKGMTMRHPGVAPEQRGTFLGLADDAVLDHWRALGVTTIELMPVQHSLSERALSARGLVNYWGYNPIGYFAPDARFAVGPPGAQVTEFKTMVKRLHSAGFEVLLDVVFNHTAEGAHDGPTLAFRGLDNAVYYRLAPDDPRRYVNLTGCGNTLDITHPRVLQLVLDSLRYWVGEMHVDGFRFDIAPVLGRDPDAFTRHARFFETVRQDPTLAPAKLIAEPWDLGPDGRHLGAFPAGWGEWNDRYRDGARRFWRGDRGLQAEMAFRLAGSSDLFDREGRGPFASINYVTSHDGFTLRDVVSYAQRHNDANPHDGADGMTENFSANWGAEGPTTDNRVQTRRERAMRNFIATLVFSQGVPMLSHGDEIGRTQLGNNNPYCHDGELTWMDWTLGPAEWKQLEFTQRAVALRRANPVLRRRHFFRGQPVGAGGAKDVDWLRADGAALTDADWHDPHPRALGMLIDAATSDERDERGRLAGGETVLLLLNPTGRAVRFRLPPLNGGGVWVEELNTARSGSRRPARGHAVSLAAHSLQLLQREAFT
jgi:glycogen operon protein